MGHGEPPSLDLMQAFQKVALALGLGLLVGITRAMSTTLWSVSPMRATKACIGSFRWSSSATPPPMTISKAVCPTTR